MHNNHINPAQIRARIRRTLDPCMVQKAALQRDGESICTADVWRYKKASFSAGLAMALSGVLSGGAQDDRAMVISELPKGIDIRPEDELAFTDGGRWRIVSASPWPGVGTAAIITLTLAELEP